MRILFAILLSVLLFPRISASLMVTETPERFIANNGCFVLTIARDSGMIASLRLVGSEFEFAGGGGSLFFPEFAWEYPDGSFENWTSASAKYLGGKTTTKLLVNTDEIAIIKGNWDTNYIDTEWEYRVIKDRPYFIVYVQRKVDKTGVYANAQQCLMITTQMDDAYITDYSGDLLCTCSNRNCLYPAGSIQHSLFTAIDNGKSNRYPAMIWHDDENNLVFGVLVPYVTPNQRETISQQNTGIHSKFWEGQWNWFGKSDNESLYLRKGTTYGMEMYYYLNRGDVDTFDTFNRNLFNQNHYDLEESEDYWAASWGSRRCHLADYSWTYPQASSNYICSQELFRYKGISLPRSQNSTLSPEIFDLSVKAIMEGRAFDLTPLPTVNDSPPLHKKATFSETPECMIGEVSWEVNSLENTLQYQMFGNSDKLIVKGEVTPTKDSVLVKELFVELALPWDFLSREIYKIDDFTWDIRRDDSIYGTVGVTVYNPADIDTVERYGRSLRLYILRNQNDRRYDSRQHWSYQFYLFPHLGYKVTEASQITALYSKPPRYYREYYQTLPGLEDCKEVGICPGENFFAYDASLSGQDEGKEVKIALYAAPGSYPIRFFFKDSQVMETRLNGSPLPEENWHFDPTTDVLTVKTNWRGITRLDIFLAEKSSGVHLTPSPGPLEFTRLWNYPNPFSFDTVVSFWLPECSEAELVIYNLMGEKVKTLVRGYLPAGYYNLCWNGTDNRGHRVASGVYLCCLKMAKTTRVQKMLLLR